MIKKLTYQKRTIAATASAALLLLAALGTVFLIRGKPEEGNRWKEYVNGERGFSLKYPPNLEVKEFDEGETTYTVVFADEGSKENFQIFFTPYSNDAITTSRMWKDIPSGRFSSPTEVVLGDGTHALVFWSQEDAELREVWFLHGNYLFEVTAPRELDVWLSEIMQTWKFTR